MATTYTIKTAAAITYNKGIVKDSSNRLHVVYGRTVTKKNIFHAYSDDDGQTWIEEAITTDTTYGQDYPSIVVDSNDNLHVVWYGKSSSSQYYYQIRYSKYTTSWSAPANLTSGNYDQSNPDIAINSSNNLYVVWNGNDSSNETYTQIKYSKYTTSWSTPVNLTSGNYYQSTPDAVVDSSNNLHIVWFGKSASSPSYYQIRYSVSLGTPVDITNESYDQDAPIVNVDSSNNRYVVWYGKSSSSTTYTQIRYSKYISSWSTPIDLTNDAYNQQAPSIGIESSSNNLYVVWNGKDSSSPDADQIRYSKYISSWSTPIDLTAGIHPSLPEKIVQYQYLYFVYLTASAIMFYIEALPSAPIQRILNKPGFFVRV